MLTFLSQSLRRILNTDHAGPSNSAPGGDCDISIALQPAAFVAGEGARIYSLDAFRRERAGGPLGPKPAAGPRRPPRAA